jgi:distribution and morphology protein 31
LHSGSAQYTFSVFNASIPQLRKQWLFFDLLSADLITGQVDNCLFSLHKPQSIGRTAVEDLSDTSWKRMSRFRVDGVPIDHLQSTRDTGPLSWITSGKVDMVADIRFPREPEDDVDLSSMIMENLKGTFDEAIGARIPGQPELRKPALEAPKRLSVTEGVETAIEGGEEGTEETSRKVDISLDIRFKDVKAAVPVGLALFRFWTDGLRELMVLLPPRNRSSTIR